MTTKLTDRQLKMCAPAGGYEIYEQAAETWIRRRDEGVFAFRFWRPLGDNDDALQLAADAELDIEWQRNLNPKKSQVRASHYAVKFTVHSDWLKVSDYPSAPEAMRWAIVLCGVAKGEAMTKEKDNDR